MIFTVYIKAIIMWVLCSEVLHLKMNKDYPIIDRSACYLSMARIEIPLLIFRLLMYKIDELSILYL